MPPADRIFQRQLGDLLRFNDMAVAPRRKAKIDPAPEPAPVQWNDLPVNPFLQVNPAVVNVPIPPPRWDDDDEEFFAPPPEQVVVAPVAPKRPEFRSIPERTTRMPRFKVRYDTVDECRLRLDNTFVTFQDEILYVAQCRGEVQCDLTHERGMGVVAYDSTGMVTHRLIDEHGMNLRTPDPGYVTISNIVFFFVRHPARVYKQGITADNTTFYKIGQDMPSRVIGNMQTHNIVKGLNDRPVIKYTPDVLDNRRRMVRLSDRVALYKTEGNWMVEHRGKTIGILNEADGRIVTDRTPSIWLDRALSQVGLTAL